MYYLKRTSAFAPIKETDNMSDLHLFKTDTVIMSDKSDLSKWILDKSIREKLQMMSDQSNTDIIKLEHI